MLLLLSCFSCVRLCDLIDGSPPGSSVPGILLARTLEWVAISFSNACMHAKSLQSCPTLCDPMDRHWLYEYIVTNSHKSKGRKSKESYESKEQRQLFWFRVIRVGSSDLMVFLVNSIKNSSKEKWPLFDKWFQKKIGRGNILHFVFWSLHNFCVHIFITRKL